MKNENQKLLAIHLNEFNYNYLKYGSRKYNLYYLKWLTNLKKVSTFTKDKIQNKNLDPWVQGVSINTGRVSKKHKILKLGQKIPKSIISIWDVLSKKKIPCYIWGPMNSTYNKNKYIKLFFPDPWNYETNPCPKDLDMLHKLPRYYAKNYLDFSLLKISIYSIYFIIGLLKNNITYFFIKNFGLLTRSILTKGLKNYVLFFIFDLISLHIFKKKNSLNNKKFSFIFLNSLAHYQHNNWDEKNSEKIYFSFVDRIGKYIHDLNSNHTSMVLFNGFKQIKINKEYLIRPINPVNFLKKIINFKTLEQDMTNGGYIFFKNKSSTNKAFKIISDYKVCGLKIFETNHKKINSFYYRINIKTLSNLKNIKLDKVNNNFIKNNIKTNKKTNFKINFKKEEYLNFLNDIELIKTTGIHANEGEILYKNFKDLKKIKKIENHKIFYFLKNFFN